MDGSALVLTVRDVNQEATDASAPITDRDSDPGGKRCMRASSSSALLDCGATWFPPTPAV